MTNYVKLTDKCLSIQDISDSVTSPTTGATSIFVGTTRNNFNGRKVIRLEYEAYPAMAEAIMKDICDEVRSKWPSVENISIHHRTGVVLETEASVVIAISSPHRLEAIEAVQYTIDTLKSKVPIWKKEIYDNEEAAWKENKECSWSTNH